MFSQADSHEMLIKDATFSRPSGFDDKLSEIKRKMAQLRGKT
jgi:hypothetical protein